VTATAGTPAPVGGPTGEPLLSARDIHTYYGHIHALQGITMEVHQGEIVTLLGANGAGKSTALMAVSGIVRPQAGTMTWDGVDLARASSFDIVARGVIHCPEGRRIFGGLTVLENLKMGSMRRVEKKYVHGVIDRVFSLFPVLAERRHQSGATLSGGEQQMLAIGRALMAQPRLLMLDEPSLGLAPAVVESMYETFGRLHREGLTILLAEQSIELALEVSDFATVLQVGKSVLSGTAASLAEDPQVQKAYLGG